ncbi:NADH dehydrogenase [ubiquinone] 1 alpha subcomplex subunit 5 [Liparis tanakae]|uniref:NADH dehydrogenase [ubiquinone] 1 alpha subcomplex subunit 5 n=1 Tax=Liparis tanakae TaxID=230148 RepID=A0A4Z2F417_9TELE|nr:NADH dehydrogenase [ubiquinone] 1 alpha subcomplex subunit 5 [Liparis tanakae]
MRLQVLYRRSTPSTIITDVIFSGRKSSRPQEAMAGLLKKTTGLVGLAVSHSPHEHLSILYSKILVSLEGMPRDAAYRKYTEQLISERFNHVKAVSESPDTHRYRRFTREASV